VTYFYWLLRNACYRQFYEASAIVRSEEGGTMTMLTQGLNAIDFRWGFWANLALL
jgi:hypothetical protein